MNNPSLLFDALMSQAYHLGISDIHISMQRDDLVFQFRRNKRFIQVFETDYGKALFEYIKYISGLQLNRYQEPQSSQFSYIVEDKELFIRFAIVQTQAQTHAVLRILNQNSIHSLDDCGFKHAEIDAIRAFYTQDHGLLLFTGSTGSGKSTSMFASLNELKGKQIISLENPVEQFFEHLIQLYTPSRYLEDYVTQILRHDPDIICIGEIRTHHELFQCLRCILTGHLVVATMHAGSMTDVTLRFQELNTNHMPLETLVYGVVHQSLMLDIHGEVHLEAHFYSF